MTHRQSYLTLLLRAGPSTGRLSQPACQALAIVILSRIYETPRRHHWNRARHADRAGSKILLWQPDRGHERDSAFRELRCLGAANEVWRRGARLRRDQILDQARRAAHR